MYDSFWEMTDFHPTECRLALAMCMYQQGWSGRRNERGGFFLDSFWSSDHVLMAVDVDIERMLHIGTEDVRVKARSSTFYYHKQVDG